MGSEFVKMEMRILLAALCIAAAANAVPVDPTTIVPESQTLLESRATTMIGLHRRPRSAEAHARLIEWIGNTHKTPAKADFVQDHVTKRLVSQTTLKNADMVEYYGQVTVGGQNFAVVYDTGSGIFWVPGENCNDDACGNHEQLKPSKDILLEEGDVDITYGTGHMSGQRAIGTLLLVESQSHAKTSWCQPKRSVMCLIRAGLMACLVWARALLLMSCAKKVTTKVALHLGTSTLSSRTCCRSQFSHSTSHQTSSQAQSLWAVPTPSCSRDQSSTTLDSLTIIG